MKNQQLTVIALALGAMGSGAQAADLAGPGTTRVQSGLGITRIQPSTAMSQLATEGIGYSVLRLTPGVPSRSHRVQVTCTVGDTYSIAYCPTASYAAYCPSATIVCGEGKRVFGY